VGGGGFFFLALPRSVGLAANLTLRACLFPQ